MVVAGVVVVVVFELVTVKVGETPVLLFRSYVNFMFVTIFLNLNSTK